MYVAEISYFPKFRDKRILIVPSLDFFLNFIHSFPNKYYEIEMGFISFWHKSKWIWLVERFVIV